MEEHKINEYQQHIDKLGTTIKTTAPHWNESGCMIIQEENMPGMMYVEEEPPRIEGPIIGKVYGIKNPQFAYFIMLHEIGHVALGHTQGRPPYKDRKFYFDNGVLRSEAEAWEWALNNASESPNRETKLLLWERCLGTYYTGSINAKGSPTTLSNGNRHHIEFVYDKPDAYFWSIKDRMLG